ncbi:DEAD/DEAH box helicase [Taklimakanibacter lacteus]|uniref:DEAD/DEAH box helicase n=1 Tax=Taklimakanibacter lacteus TaxID=2268456 RepID=UPI000E6602DD
MRPKDATLQSLAAVRATAKMYEFRAAPEDFVRLRRDPRSLFALAVGILGDAAAAISDRFIDGGEGPIRPGTWEERDGSVAEMVRFSATFFDAYLEARLDIELTQEFSLLCAASYYLSDSVGSALVVARRSEAPSLDLGHGLARLAYAILRGEFDPIPGEHIHAEFATRLLAALRRHFRLEGDSDEIRAICAELRKAAYDNGSARELLYADVVTALSARKLGNSARTLLPPASNLPLDSWVPALMKGHFPKELWPAQQRICQAGLLQGRSAVVQMPTSAGKTRGTELIIRSAFLSGRATLAVIVAPFRSLCHDIRSDLATAFAGEDIVLDEVSDSFLLDVDIDEIFAQKSVLVVTPEKMLYMLRRAPELAEQIGLVIYDEGHQFEGFARGPTYELLLSSLRMSLAPKAQVVLISAVIGNAGQIAGWLIHDENAIVSGDGLLPTPKSIAFASWQHERGWLQYVSPDDPETTEFFVPRIIQSLPLALKDRERKQRVFPDRGGTSESGEIGLYLGLHLVENGSVAVFCGTKETVVGLCERVAEIFDRDVDLKEPLEVSDGDEIEKLVRLTRRNLGEHNDTKAARHGVLAHHGNTPHGLRLSIEYAMKVGHAKFVICTSTLAQGVNFPIRYLIVTATQQGKEKIKVRDFHNLMGRAGRAGMHTEGSVIFSAPSIYDERKLREQRWRWRAAKDLLDPEKSEPSRSSILDLFASYEQAYPAIVLQPSVGWLDLAFADRNAIEKIVTEVVHDYPLVIPADFRKFVMGRARAVQSIAAYLAAYVDFESDQASERIEELARNTLAYYLADEETREKLVEVFRTTAAAVEASGDADFRGLIRKSPLPPADVLELKEWTTNNIAVLLAAAEAGELLEVVFEQARKYVGAKSITSLSDPDVLLPTLKRWIDGGSFYELRDPLVEADVRFGRYKATAEHMVALCENGFGFELAMVVASIADLVEPIDDELFKQIVRVQRQIKNGLSDPAALAFFEAGFADRVVAQVLGEKFNGVVDRAGVRRVCRNQTEDIRDLLDEFPSYFRTVIDELGAG